MQAARDEAWEVTRARKGIKRMKLERGVSERRCWCAGHCGLHLSINICIISDPTADAQALALDKSRDTIFRVLGFFVMTLEDTRDT